MEPTQVNFQEHKAPMMSPPLKHTRRSNKKSAFPHPFIPLPSHTETQFIDLPYARSPPRQTMRITNRPSHLYLNPASKTFTHDELLTSIPVTPPPVTAASFHTPINSLLTALVDFELSIEVRDRLTRAELVAFDRVFVSKVKQLGTCSIEGTYSQHLQALKRLTKARAHLNKYKPEVVDDISRIVGNLLEMLGHDGESLQVVPQQTKQEPQLPTAMNAEPSVVMAPKVQIPEKMQLSSIIFDSTVIKRAPGHRQLYLHCNEKEACLEIKGLKGRAAGSGDQKIACATIRAIGDMSRTEISIGTQDGPEIGFELKDEKDAEFLLQKLELLSGVTAYTARCY